MTNWLKNAINEFNTGWEEFWFVPISTSGLAAFRILFGLLLIQYAWLLLPDIYVWLGKNGMVPSVVANTWQPHIRLNILNLFPNNDLWLNTIFVLFVISAFSLTVGLMTRASVIVAFICLSSLHARNYLILNSGDVFMRMLCFWLIFSPAGKTLSIDSWLRHSGEKRGEEPCESPPWAQRLMQINLSLLYAQAFTKKIIGVDWQNGTAVYFSSKMAEMHRFPLYYLFDHLWTCRLISWAVLGIEFSLCTLIWVKPFRYYVLALGIVMHLFIDWTMNIPQFEWIMIVTYILFIEPVDMERLLNMTKRLLLKLVRKLHFNQALV